MESQDYFKFQRNCTEDCLQFSLQALLELEALTDVTIVCENGQRIAAHKVVLAASSKYFKEILMEHSCEHPIIIMPEMKYQLFKDVLEFIYLGTVLVKSVQRMEFLDTIEMLKIQGINPAVADFPEPSSMDASAAPDTHLSTVNDKEIASNERVENSLNTEDVTAKETQNNQAISQLNTNTEDVTAKETQNNQAISQLNTNTEDVTAKETQNNQAISQLNTNTEDVAAKETPNNQAISQLNTNSRSSLKRRRFKRPCKIIKMPKQDINETIPRVLQNENVESTYGIEKKVIPTIVINECEYKQQESGTSKANSETQDIILKTKESATAAVDTEVVTVTTTDSGISSENNIQSEICTMASGTDIDTRGESEINSTMVIQSEIMEIRECRQEVSSANETETEINVINEFASDVNPINEYESEMRMTSQVGQLTSVPSASVKDTQQFVVNEGDPKMCVNESYAETAVANESYAETAIENESYIETTVEIESYAETIVANESYVETTVEIESYAETIVADESYVETAVAIESYVEPTVANESYVETTVEIESYAETIVADESYVETAVAIESYVEPTVANESYVETIVANENYAETAIENENYAETTVANESYAEAIVANESYAETTVENEADCESDTEITLKFDPEVSYNYEAASDTEADDTNETESYAELNIKIESAVSDNNEAESDNEMTLGNENTASAVINEDWGSSTEKIVEANNTNNLTLNVEINDHGMHEESHSSIERVISPVDTENDKEVATEPSSEGDRLMLVSDDSELEDEEVYEAKQKLKAFEDRLRSSSLYSPVPDASYKAHNLYSDVDDSSKESNCPSVKHKFYLYSDDSLASSCATPAPLSDDDEELRPVSLIVDPLQKSSSPDSKDKNSISYFKSLFASGIKIPGTSLSNELENRNETSSVSNSKNSISNMEKVSKTFISRNLENCSEKSITNNNKSIISIIDRDQRNNLSDQSETSNIHAKTNLQSYKRSDNTEMNAETQKSKNDKTIETISKPQENCASASSLLPLKAPISKTFKDLEENEDPLQKMISEAHNKKLTIRNPKRKPLSVSKVADASELSSDVTFVSTLEKSGSNNSRRKRKSDLAADIASRQLDNEIEFKMPDHDLIPVGKAVFDDSSIKRQVCLICNKSYVQSSHVNRHHKTAHPGIPMPPRLRIPAQSSDIKCPLCCKNFTSHKLLWQHMTCVHNKYKTRTKKGPDNRYKCPKCPKSFTHPKNVKLHYLSHSVELFSESPVDLASQVLMRMDGVGYVTKEKDGYRCKICDKQFKILAYLKSHIKNLHYNATTKVRDLELTCPICVKKFETLIDINNHLHYVHNTEIIESHNYVTSGNVSESLSFYGESGSSFSKSSNTNYTTFDPERAVAAEILEAAKYPEMILVRNRILLNQVEIQIIKNPGHVDNDSDDNVPQNIESNENDDKVDNQIRIAREFLKELGGEGNSTQDVLDHAMTYSKNPEINETIETIIKSRNLKPLILPGYRKNLPPNTFLFTIEDQKSKASTESLNVSCVSSANGEDKSSDIDEDNTSLWSDDNTILFSDTETNPYIDEVTVPYSHEDYIPSNSKLASKKIKTSSSAHSIRSSNSLTEPSDKHVGLFSNKSSSSSTDIQPTPCTSRDIVQSSKKDVTSSLNVRKCKKQPEIKTKMQPVTRASKKRLTIKAIEEQEAKNISENQLATKASRKQAMRNTKLQPETKQKRPINKNVRLLSTNHSIFPAEGMEMVKKALKSGSTNTYLCLICSVPFPEKELMEAHVELEHPNFLEDMALSQSLIKCKKCKQAFHVASQLNEHMENVHRSTISHSIICKLCGRSLSNLISLRSHYGIQHPTSIFSTIEYM